MLFRILVLVCCLSILNACGNNNGSTEGTASNGGDSSGGGTTEVSLEDFSGVKLTLSSGAGVLESDYYLYPDGIADYVLRDVYEAHPPITRLKWSLERNSLFVNNGSKRLGSGYSTPQEFQFDSRPSIGDEVRVKNGNSVFTTTRIIAIESEGAIHAEVKLTKDDFYGKAIEFSHNGSTDYASIVRLKFTDETMGVWESGDKKLEFSWLIVSENTLRLDYSNGSYTEYEFRFGMSLGETVYVLMDIGLASLFEGETTLVNSYLL